MQTPSETTIATAIAAMGRGRAASRKASSRYENSTAMQKSSQITIAAASAAMGRERVATESLKQPQEFQEQRSYADTLSGFNSCRKPSYWARENGAEKRKLAQQRWRHYASLHFAFV